MSIDTKHIVAAVALLALGYYVGKRGGVAAATNSPTVASDAAAQAEWWTYAGSWAL